MIITTTWLIAMLCAAILACWIASQSTLIQKLKAMLWLTPTERKTKYKWWFRPIVFIWQELQDLLDCPFCISFHLGWIVTYFYFHQDIITALLYGTIAVLFVELYQKLQR